MQNRQFLQQIATIIFILLFVGLFSFPSHSQRLPSPYYNDYDEQKHLEILNQLEFYLRQSHDELTRADQDLEQAKSHETRLGRELEIAQRDIRRIKEEEEPRIQQSLRQAQQSQEDIKRTNENLSREITGVETQLPSAKSNVDRLQVVASSTQNELNQAASELKPLKDIIQNKQQGLNEIIAAARKQDHVIQELQRQLAKAKTDEEKAAIQVKLDAENIKATELLNAKNAAEAELRTAQSNAAAKQQDYDRAKAKNDAAQSDLSTAQRRLSEIQTLISSKQSEMNKNLQKISDLQNKEKEYERALVDNNRKLDELAQRTRRLDEDIRNAISNTNQAQRRRDRAAQEYSFRARDRDEGLRRLSEVRNNIEQARSLMSSDATRKAQIDGTKAGEELGKHYGQINGEYDGKTKGTSDGIHAGQDRDYDKGVDQGISEARVDAQKDSLKNSAGNRSSEGYNTGRSLGESEGYQYAYNKQAFQEGRIAGLEKGLQEAIRDAAVEEPKGYQAQEQKYLNAPLKSITVGDLSTDAIKNQFSGTQDRVSGIPDGDERAYFQPFPPTQYEARLNQLLSSFYLPVYNQVFYNNFDQVGARVYQNNYATTYRTAYNQNYNREFNKNYPHYQEAGRSDAYLGYADGNAIGSRKKGFDLARKESYDKNIEPERKKAFQSGVARADALYLNHAVIKIEEIQIQEVDQDGIFRPGEKVRAVFKVKNFGHAAKNDLRVLVASISSTAELLSESVLSASIPGVSFATVYAEKQIQIKAQSEENSQLSVEYLLADQNALAKQRFNKVIQFPAATQFLDFDGVILPGETSQLKLSVTNRSQKKQSLQLNISADLTKLALDQNQINIDSLKVGETKNLILKVTGKPEARFEEAQILIQAVQNDILFGQLMTNVTIIKKHSSTKESLGLIISHNLAKGEGKHLYSKAKFDTWDLRVDGTLTASALANYANKVVSIMADQTALLDTASSNTLIKFVQDGGQLIIWGSDMDQSQVATQLASISFAKLSRASGINENIMGQSTLAGLVTAYSGQAGNIALNGRKVRTVLMSEIGGIAVQSFAKANIMDKQVGRIYSLAINPQNLTSEFIAELHKTIQKMAIPFKTKLDLAMKDLKVLNLVFLDIQEEVLFSEAEKQDLYKDKKNNKSFKALEKVVASGSKTAKAQFGKGFKMIADTVKNLNIKGTVMNVLENTRAGGVFGGANWKDLFCEQKENYGSEYCKKVGPIIGGQ